MQLDIIYNEDCLEGMKRLSDESIDLVVTDPPYGTTACQWDSIIPLEPMWKQLKRIIKPNGAIVMTASQPFTTTLIASNRRMFKYCWVWNKGRGVGHLLSEKRPMMCTEDIVVFYEDLTQRKQKITSFVKLRKYFEQIFNFIGIAKKKILKEIGQKADHCFRYGSKQWDLPTQATYQKLIKKYSINLLPQFKSYELLRIEYRSEESKLGDLVYNPQMRKREKPRVSKTKQTDNTCYGNLKDYEGRKLTKKYPINLIRFSKSSHRDMLLHSTQKPVALIEYLIKTYTNEGEIVLDFAMGSGTTAVACKKLGRYYIGFEINSDYCKVAEQRLEAEKTLFRKER